MNIIDIPMIDYLKYCKKTVSSQGYQWIMVLLAREIEAKESYEQLREDWNSFNDITSNNILFVFTVSRKKLNIEYDANGISDDISGVVSTPGLSIFNGENIIKIVKRHVFSKKWMDREQRNALENNTNIISDLCREYRIDESMVPAILLFNVEKGMRQPFVIPITTDDLYGTIKGLLIATTQEREQYTECIKKLRRVKPQIKSSNSSGYAKYERDIQDIFENPQTVASLTELKNDADVAYEKLSAAINNYCDKEKEGEPLSALLPENNKKTEDENEKMSFDKDTPRVFISYSWDSTDHKEWVRSLAEQLRKDGIDVYLDQDDLSLGDRLPLFMEENIQAADYVVLVCTRKYKEKADGRVGGAGYEGNIISGELFSLHNEKKYIPIVRNGEPDDVMPVFLAGKLAVILNDGDSGYKQNYEDLRATLRGERKRIHHI